jgi:hypothetical protein
VPYAFTLRGVACYSTYGEAEYHENNREQSFGDVIEATHAYALRRFAKRLGVGLELWNKQFGEAWIEKYAVCVYVTNREGQSKRMWRRRDAAPLRGEGGRAKVQDTETPHAQREQTRRRPQAQAERIATPHPKGDTPVSNEQLIRFWTIARGRGRTDDEVKAFLHTHYHLTSSKDMKKADYESIVKAIEHPGPLLPVLDIEREPGADDE